MEDRDAITPRWPPRSTCRRAIVIINSRSGARNSESVAARVEEFMRSRGFEVWATITGSADELMKAASHAAAADADIVVAGGGDGTIAAVAAALLDSSKVLGVLPLGTFNYFARRIGVPLDVEAALEVIAAGVPAAVSVGELNGRVFLNNSSIGLYPTVLHRRETTYRRIGRSQAVAYLSVARTLIQPPGLVNLLITADGTRLPRRTPLLFVGVNPLQLASFAVPGEECLAVNRMALCILRPLSVVCLWRLAFRAFFNGLYGASELEVVCAGEAEVTLRPRRVQVAMDGEIAIVNPPLRYRLRVDALKVLVGPQAQDVQR